MRPPRPRLVSLIAGTALLGSLAASPVLAEPTTPSDEPAVEHEVDGVPVLVDDGEVVGLLPPTAGGPAMLTTTQYADRSLITPLTSTGAPVGTTDLTALAADSSPRTSTRDGVTTLQAPSRMSASATQTPDYCRDPANGMPTQPAPGKVPVTVSTIDRNGAPSGGTFTMMDYHCEPYEANGYIAFGVPHGAGRTFYLPPGDYSIVGQITTPDASGTLPQAVTFGGDPQFEVVADQPLDLTIDARDGEPLVIDTPETTTPAVVVLGWMRGIEGNPPLLESTVMYPQGSPLTEISVIPSEEPTDGVFEFFPWVRSSEPWASGTLLGRGGPLGLEAKLINSFTSATFEGVTTLRGDLDALEPGDGILLTDGPGLAAQVREAEQAGAAAVLIRPAGEGLTWPNVSTSLPVLALPAEQGATVAERIEAMGGGAPVRLAVDPTPDSVYDLVDGLPAIEAQPYAGLTEDDLTTVTQTFHGHDASTLTLETRAPTSPCTCLLTPIFDMVEPGSTRVDHVIDNGSQWQQTVVQDYRLQVRSSSRAYDATTDPETHWLSGSIGAGLKAGFGPSDSRAPAVAVDGQVRLRMGATDGEGHDIAGRFTRSGSVTRDGELVADAFTGFATLPAPAEEVPWRVELTTTHAPDLWPHSTAVTSAWEFTAGGNAGAEPEALPLLDVRTSFPVDTTAQRLPGGALVVEPWALDGSLGESVAVDVELSRDGGQTWVAQSGRMAQGVWSATPVRGSGPVDVRLTVTDGSGSTLTRTIQAAWTD